MPIPSQVVSWVYRFELNGDHHEDHLRDELMDWLTNSFGANGESWTYSTGWNYMTDCFEDSVSFDTKEQSTLFYLAWG